MKVVFCLSWIVDEAKISEKDTTALETQETAAKCRSAVRQHDDDGEGREGMMLMTANSSSRRAPNNVTTVLLFCGVCK